MQSLVLCLALVISVACAFQPRAGLFRLATLRRVGVSASMPPQEVEQESKTVGLSLVPLERKNIENCAAVTGGILGLVLTGPVGAAVFAAVSNYIVKRDTEPGEALRGVGKTIIESYNFLYKLNAKYCLTDRASRSFANLFDSVDADSEVFHKVKKAVINAADKAVELNDEFDLIGKGKQVVGAAAKVSEATIEKTIELDEKYHFVESAKDLAKRAVDNLRESLKQQR